MVFSSAVVFCIWIVKPGGLIKNSEGNFAMLMLRLLRLFFSLRYFKWGWEAIWNVNQNQKFLSVKVHFKCDPNDGVIHARSCGEIMAFNTFPLMLISCSLFYKKHQIKKSKWKKKFNDCNLQFNDETTEQKANDDMMSNFFANCWVMKSKWILSKCCASYRR